MAKINIKNVRKYIDLKYQTWVNDTSTNCYAFALGLDIPEKEICPHAYDGGYIYKYFTEKPKNISSLTNQEIIELDFQTLKLYYEQIDIKDHIYSPHEWKIAFFDDYTEDQDFHFFREVEDSVWYHKYGRKEHPTCFDEDGVLITNPIYAELGTEDYIYKHCYRLSKKKF